MLSAQLSKFGWLGLTLPCVEAFATIAREPTVQTPCSG